MQCEAMIIDIQQVSQQRPWQKCQSIHSFHHPPGFQLLLQVWVLGEFFCMTASWDGFNRSLQHHTLAPARGISSIGLRIEAGCGRQIAGCIYSCRAVTAQGIAHPDTLPCGNQGEWVKGQSIQDDSTHRPTPRHDAQHELTAFRVAAAWAGFLLAKSCAFRCRFAAYRYSA